MQQVMFDKVCVLCIVYMLRIVTYYHPTTSNMMMKSIYDLVHKQNITWLYSNLTLSHLITSVLSYNPWLIHCLWKHSWWTNQSLCCLWSQTTYHNYDRPTSASWLWRNHDVWHNQNNCSALRNTVHQWKYHILGRDADDSCNFPWFC